MNRFLKFNKTTIILATLLLVVGILVWSPWITEDFARDKIVQYFEKNTVSVDHEERFPPCYFSDYAGEVVRRVPFGSLVEGTVTCVTPAGGKSDSQKTFFVSPFLTVYQIKTKIIIPEGIVVFRLIDGEKNTPAADWTIRICDASIEPQPCLDDKSALASRRTDKNGVFYFNPDLASKYGFWINPGHHYQYAKINVGREDSVAANYKPGFVYVMETEKTGKMLRWKDYNLKTKEVTIREEGESISQSYGTIDITVFYDPGETRLWM